MIDNNLDFELEDELATEFFNLKNNLQIQSEKGLKMFLIHASLPGEGSTFIAKKLARTFANDRNKKVLYVDINLRNRIMDNRIEKGISDAVVEKNNLNDYVNSIDNKNLSYITSGTRLDNPIAILESDDFDRVVSEIKEDFDIIIWDCAPANLYPDCIYLAKKVDSIIVIAEAERVKMEVIKNITDRYKMAGLPISGVILNKKRYYIPNLFYKNI